MTTQSNNINAFETFFVLISILCFFLCFVNPPMIFVLAVVALASVLGFHTNIKIRARWENLPVQDVSKWVKRVTLFGICFLSLSSVGFFATKKLDAWLEHRIPKRQSWVQPLSPLASLKG